ncbi:LuxR family transcriptional regulator, maltose regulon positive regulatory protein [Paramicrobacterium humi]|uniref:LuxR family transcriptional regulator, maltose regulon positive regulatory protein n=1 Tax=Paramicrobacterium humi TaxID=640635 RepID=A0A1H4NFU9_9MICO|nr:LuxR C-terminal-related transcriptional regulator [Microbacterium humi]SEB94081.1 LuxR family transcriptional regulator, maltose regulon positive regulatory protein [Microbacterium humi]
MTLVHGAPRLPVTVLERERLLCFLDEDSAITVVRASAGSGKTVLLTQWTRRAADAGARVVWLGASPESSGRLAFWAELGRRFAMLSDEPEFSLLGTLSESLSATPDVSPLLGTLFGRLPEQVTVVVDNGQMLDEQVLRDLVDVVAVAPALRVIVGTRSRTPLAALEAMTRVPVSLIEGSDLALTADETAELLGPDSDLAETVLSASDGNALVTHALVLSLSRTPEGEGRLNTVLSEVRNALGGSLLGSISRLEDERFFDFVLRIARSSGVTLELARELTGCDDSDALLVRVEESGLGLWTRTAKGELFTLTTLVREALAAEHERRLPAEGKHLDAIIARWELRTGKPLEALARAISIGDYDLVALVIKSAWYRFVSEHKLAVSELLSRIPLTTLMRRPLVAMLLALIYNQSPNHRLKAVEFFGLAVAASRLMRNTPPADAALLRGMESAALRVIGQSQRAAAAAERTTVLLGGLDVSSREELGTLLPVLGNHAGVSLLHAGRTTEARELFKAALADADLLGTHFRFQPLANLAGLDAILGNIVEARSTVSVARTATWPARWKDGYAGAFYRVAEAILALELGDPAAASEHLRLLDPHLSTIEHWPAIAYLHGFVALASGEPVLGLEKLARTREWHAARPTTFMHSALTSIESQLHLAVGDVAASARLLRGSSGGPVLALARARHALVVGEVRVVAAQLAQAASAGLSSDRLRAEHAVLELALLLREGRDSGHQAQAALALLTARELRMPLLQVPAEDLLAITALADRMGGRTAEFIAEAPLPTGLRMLAEVPTLTPRELVILEQLATQRTLPEIAAQLVVSRNTIKAQSRSLYRKLGVGSRDDAVAEARRHGLL